MIEIICFGGNSKLLVAMLTCHYTVVIFDRNDRSAPKAPYKRVETMTW